MRTYVRAAAVAAVLAAAFAAPAGADAGCVTTWVESHGKSEVAVGSIVKGSAGVEPGGPVWVNPYPAANFAGGVVAAETGYAVTLVNCVV